MSFESLPAAGPTLDPATYARGHQLFEGLSDQRAMIVAWLCDRLRQQAAAQQSSGLSVLSVGCGDGAVDAAVAAQVSDPGWAWTGVDPHAPNVDRLVSRFEDLPAPAPRASGHASRFADLPGDAAYDVVTFVHSLYYVEDLADALLLATSRLAPGGELLVVHAPLGALNELAARFAPPVAGHAQPWSAEVEWALAALPVDVEAAELDAVVDLTTVAEADPSLLEFVVQAPLDDEQRADALAGLRAVAQPGPGLRVPHPATTYRVRPR